MMVNSANNNNIQIRCDGWKEIYNDSDYTLRCNGNLCSLEVHISNLNINNWFQSMGVWGLAINSCIESFFLLPPPDFLLILRRYRRL